MLKRGYTGVYHNMSVKRLDRYVIEFSGRHNIRPMDTLGQMVTVFRGMQNKRLRYEDLIGPPWTRQPEMIQPTIGNGIIGGGTWKLRDFQTTKRNP